MRYLVQFLDRSKNILSEAEAGSWSETNVLEWARRIGRLTLPRCACLIRMGTKPSPCPRAKRGPSRIRTRRIEFNPGPSLWLDE